MAPQDGGIDWLDWDESSLISLFQQLSSVSADAFVNAIERGWVLKHLKVRSDEPNRKWASAVKTPQSLSRWSNLPGCIEATGNVQARGVRPTSYLLRQSPASTIREIRK
jgi:hypothetical protein